MKKRTDRGIRLFLVLLFFESGAAALWLGKIGERSLNGFLFGFSAIRFAMIIFLLFLSLSALVCLLLNIRGKGAWINKILSFTSLRFVCFAIFFTSFFIILYTGFLKPAALSPVYQRFLPFGMFAVIVSVEALILNQWLIHSNTLTQQPFSRKNMTALSVSILFWVGILIIVHVSKVGITPDEMDWQPTGMPVQYWEIAISFLCASLFAVLLYIFHKKLSQNFITVLLFFGVWAAAALIWTGIPTEEALNHSFFMESSAPNYVPYPVSDAAYFGLWSESILAGLGFKTAIAYRQFVITLLALFQKITDGDIFKTIDCMTIYLALIPAVLFLLGCRLHSRAAGLFAAGMAIMREYNTILLAPHFAVSSSKMWLSDLPAALCLIAAITADAAWFQKPRSVFRMFLAGFLTGLCVTVRSQFIALIPFPVLFFLFRHGLPNRQKFLRGAIFIVAAFVVIAPWFIRSKVITGAFILDDPGVHSRELARRWSDDVDNQVAVIPGETDAEQQARNQSHMLHFFLEKPDYVLNFIMSHFFANELYSLSVLPFGTDPSLTIDDVTNTDYLDIEGRVLGKTALGSRVFFVLFIALGMAACWKRCGVAGLLPFLICSLYLGSTAAARYSGWRFALPADWVYYFYFAVGFFELIFQLAMLFGAERSRLFSVSPLYLGTVHTKKWALGIVTTVFLIAGAAPALMDTLIPDQIDPKTKAENMEVLNEMSQTFNDAYSNLVKTAEQSDRQLINGRLIYPRYYGQNEGQSGGHPWASYQIRDFSRLGFVLLNRENYDVIIPLSEEPASIPNGSDVLISGKFDPGGFFRADFILFTDVYDEDGEPRLILGDTAF